MGQSSRRGLTLTLEFADRVMDTSKPRRTVLVIASGYQDGDDYGQQLQQDSVFAYQVLVERDYAQALSRCRSRQVDGILLTQPFLLADCCNLLHQLQARIGKGSPPVVVVGSSEVETAVQLLKAGAADYLVEDRTTPDKLRLALRTAIENAELKCVLRPGQVPCQPSGESSPNGSKVSTGSLTQQKQTEAALQVSQQRYRDLAEAMPQMVWTADSTGAISYWNQRWYKYTGLSEAESMGLAGASTVHPEERDRTLAEWGQAVSNGEAFEIEYRIRRWDGVYHWFICRGLPTRNRQGQIVGWIGTITDIDHIKRSEALIRQGERQLQQQLAEIEAIYQSVPIGLNVLDRDLRFVRINQKLAEINGLPVEAHIGRTVREVIPDLADVTEQLLRPILETGEPLLNVEIHGETPAQPGAKRTWLAHFLPLKDGDRVIGISTVCEEITDRKQSEAALRQSEARFRTLADNISQLAWMADEHGWIFWYNNRWFDYTGTTLEEMQGWGWRQVHHPDHVDRVVERISRCFATGEPWEDTFPLRRQDGEYRWFLSRAIPIRDEQGHVLRWFGTNTDITDRQRAEEALAQRAQELTQLNQILKATAADLNQRNQDLNQFAYVVSHDLKAPLRGIRNISEWLQEDLGDQIPPDNQDQLQLLVSRVDRMEALINDLLEYSRAGRVKQPPEHIEVGELVADVLETLSVPPEVTVRLATPLPVLEARRLMLSQVFANLISNAIKYGCPDERGEVVLSAQEQGTYYEFAIADQGPGIDPAYHEKIFGIFETLQKTDRPENTGIGLAIVKKLVEAEEGTIRLESAVGAGITFYFTWPKQVPAIREVAPPTGGGYARG